MTHVENCYEENSNADDVTSATTRCLMSPFDVNCTASEPGRGRRSKTTELVTDSYRTGQAFRALYLGD